MALTKVSRGLLSTGIVDNSNATAITLNADESATFAGNVGIGRVPRVGLDVAGEVAIAYDANYGLRFYNQPQNNWSFIGNDVTSSAADLRFGDSTGEVMRASGGNLLVGQTSPSGSATGMYFRPGQESGINSDGDSALQLNRLTSDGAILRFYQGGTNVGSIGTNSGYMVIGSPVGTDAHLLIGNGLIHPATATGASKDASIDLGGASNRFKNLYLSGGIDFNGSSGGINTANRSFLMDEYEIGTCSISLSTSGGGATLSRQDNTTGFYQKTGDICTVQFYSGGLTFTNAGSGSARIHGLPFNSKGGIYNYGVCSLTHVDAATTDLQNGFTSPNVSHITLMQRNSHSGAAWQTGGVRYLMFSVTYLTN